MKLIGMYLFLYRIALLIIINKHRMLITTLFKSSFQNPTGLATFFPYLRLGKPGLVGRHKLDENGP
jgi:hypothetical protein